MLYQLSYLPAHSCTYVTITDRVRPVNGMAVEASRPPECGPIFTESAGVGRVLNRRSHVLSSWQRSCGRRPNCRALVPSWHMQNPRTVEHARNHTTLDLEPRAAALRLPLARLLQLLMILQSERFPNARRLAEACAVSRRTIYRDLATLEAAGIDVLYQTETAGLPARAIAGSSRLSSRITRHWRF